MANAATLLQLRETLRAIETPALARRPALAFGIDPVDVRLADAGLRIDALHEFAGASPDIADDCAAALFAAGIAARTRGPLLWVVRRRDLFAPGLAQAGIAPERLLYAEARDDAELLAVMEEGLRHRGLGAVIGEARRVETSATRRLQLAAEGGRSIALLLRQHGKAGANPFGVPSAAITRWRIGAAPATPLPVEGVGRSRWAIDLVRQRGGEPANWIVEACDETGRCALPADVADRTVVAGRANQAA